MLQIKNTVQIIDKPGVHVHEFFCSFHPGDSKAVRDSSESKFQDMKLKAQLTLKCFLFLFTVCEVNLLTQGLPNVLLPSEKTKSHR